MLSQSVKTLSPTVPSPHWTSVTEKATGAASNITINGNIHAGTSATTGTVSLSDTGTGAINQAAASIITGGKSVTLSSTKGSISQLGSIVGGIDKITTTSATLGNIALNNILATNGGISVIAAGKTLTTQPGAVIKTNVSTSGKVKAPILLENKNATAGSIVIGVGSDIETVGPASSNIGISIGAAVNKDGTLPTLTGVNFTVNGTTATSPSTVILGANGITFAPNGGNINVASVGTGKAAGEVIFSTGKLGAGAITVQSTTGTTTTIKADPPVLANTATQPVIQPVDAAHTSPALAQARIDLANAINSASPVAVVQPTSGSVSSYANSTDNVAANVSLNSVNGLTIGSNAGAQGTINAVSTEVATADDAANTAHTLYGAATKFGVPTETTYVGQSALNQSGNPGEIEAAVVGGSDYGISGPKSIEMGAWTGGDTKTMTLRKGNVIIAPAHDTIVETPFGKVSVAAKSVAMIMALPSGTAVYNLDDSRKGAVQVIIGDHTVTLAPGRHAMVTSHLVSSFDMVNPAESLAHRNVTSKKFGGDLQAFTSEFMLSQTMANVKQLRALVASKNPEAQKLANHMLKTAAIVSQYGSNSAQYELYQHPRITASALAK